MKRVGLLLGAVLLCGCQYYRVRDIPTGKEYITNNWQMGENAYVGSTRFTDLKTGKEVTLQQYEREKITEEQAKQEIATRKD